MLASHCPGAQHAGEVQCARTGTKGVSDTASTSYYVEGGSLARCLLIQKSLVINPSCHATAKSAGACHGWGLAYVSRLLNHQNLNTKMSDAKKVNSWSICNADEC
jgi:hypothetical protein